MTIGPGACKAQPGQLRAASYALQATCCQLRSASYELWLSQTQSAKVAARWLERFGAKTSQRAAAGNGTSGHTHTHHAARPSESWLGQAQTRADAAPEAGIADETEGASGCISAAIPGIHQCACRCNFVKPGRRI
jgi:hypothetical protein